MRRIFCASALSALSCVFAQAGCSDGAESPVAPPDLQVAADTEEHVWITTDRDTLPWAAYLIGGEPALRTSTYEAEEERVVALRVPRRVLPELAEIAHEEHQRCGGYVLHDDEADALGQLAVNRTFPTLPQVSRVAYTVDNPAAVQAITRGLSEPNMLATVRKLSSYKNRHHASPTGQEAAKWLHQRWAALASGRSDVRVALITHARTPQASVSLTIRGTSLPDEYVVLGGHLDSIAGRTGANGVAPGADDNASGIATLTEIARAALAADYRPDRSIVFYGYAAEEVGLLGSAEIANAAKTEGRRVVGVMQLDMTNFSSAAQPYLALIRDHTSPDLNQFTIRLIETYLRMPWKYDSCGYACSDHASWATRGYATTFPHEAMLREGNKRIHTVDDTLTLTKESVSHSMHFARLGAAFVAELGKGKIGSAPASCTRTAPCAAGERCAGSVCVAPGDAGTTMPSRDAGAVLPSRDAGTPSPLACDARRLCPTGLSCRNGACLGP